MVVFVLVLLSDVLGVEFFLLSPTASGGDDAGPRFCTTLPTSPPRFRGITLKTLSSRVKILILVSPPEYKISITAIAVIETFYSEEVRTPNILHFAPKR